MTIHKTTILTLAILVCSLAVVVIPIRPAEAGPNCDKNADHPSCSDGGDGGGGGGPGGGGCALTADNPPAFAFGAAIKIKGRNASSLSLSNADGSCTASLGVDDVAGIDFHFDAGANAGAVTYSPGLEDAIYILRFQVDANGLAVEPPQLLAEQADCCLSADVTGAPGNETVAVVYLRDFEGDYLRGIELIDTALCEDSAGNAVEPCPASAVATVFELSAAERDQCVQNLVAQSTSIGDEYFVGDCYRPDWGAAPVFTDDGNRIYVNVGIPGQLGTYEGIARFSRDGGAGCGGVQDLGTGWCGPELVLTHDDRNTNPRVEGVHPDTGTLVVDYDDGIEGGLRKILIAFVDPDVCITETANRAHWMSCLAEGLPSSIIRGGDASWLRTASGYDVLYGGFDSGTRDTVRAFTPTLPASNDRELLTKANGATTGL